MHCLRNVLVLSHARRRLAVALLRNVVVASWYGLVYWDQEDAHALASVCYFSQQFVAMSNLQAVPQLFDERALFYREVAAGFYGEVPYFAARCAVNAIVQVPLVATYAAIVYPMVGLRGGLASPHFAFFFLVLFGLSLCGYAFSNLVAAAPRPRPEVSPRPAASAVVRGPSDDPARAPRRRRDPLFEQRLSSKGALRRSPPGR